MISVVIPAHNEGSVIERCLGSILRDARPGELEVIVVCNGCSDDTAARARRFGPSVQVVETSVASKSHALNLGDSRASGFPRFFVDADIEIATDSIRKVAEVLSGGAVHGAAPRMRVDLQDRGWAIRAFYRIWMRTPYVTNDMLGCGVYAVSKEGRSRFGRFPDIIADDCFVRLLFEPGERRAVDGAWFEMRPPASLRALIHINVRRRVGVFEMSGLYPDTTAEESRLQRRSLLRLARNPANWPALCVYSYVKAATVAVYRWKERRGRHKEWSRDESSRHGPPSSP